VSEFRLFTEDRQWWTAADYRSLLTVCRRLAPKRVLEFGPGGSTLAMIEAGVPHIDSCEDDPVYLDRAHELLDAHPAVTLHLYQHSERLSIPELDGQRYDFGFVDGPRNTALRLASIDYALARCTVVYCHDAWGIGAAGDVWFRRVGTIAEVLR
jgi:predicted O-methyltransferase YrrM